MNSYDKQSYEEVKREKEKKLAEYESRRILQLIRKTLHVLQNKGVNRK